MKTSELEFNHEDIEEFIDATSEAYTAIDQSHLSNYLFVAKMDSIYDFLDVVNCYVEDNFLC